MIARSESDALIGPACAEQPAAVDLERLRGYRLARVRAQLAQHDCAACVLFDPVNIRYATDSRNMSVWCLHNPARYCFVPQDGPVILFEVHRCAHLADGIDSIDEIRPATSWFFFGSGSRVAEHAACWGREIADLVACYGRGNRRLAVDRCDPAGFESLRSLDIVVCDAQAMLENARTIKSADELACIAESVAVAELGMQRMRDTLQAGMSEQALWGLLHQTNIERGGEWIETRLLSSGPRTNPWMQECSERIIQRGDLVSFDTDLIGPYGYCADISRCYVTDTDRPTSDQRTLYQLAHEQIEHNLSLIKPGVGFRELAEIAWPIPDAFADNRYSCVVHGVGLCDEYPNVAHRQDFEHGGYDGFFEAGMTVCAESYIGRSGGREGVKLEQQVLITETGTTPLSTFPFDETLLGQHI